MVLPKAKRLKRGSDLVDRLTQCGVLMGITEDTNEYVFALYDDELHDWVDDGAVQRYINGEDSTIVAYILRKLEDRENGWQHQ